MVKCGEVVAQLIVLIALEGVGGCQCASGWVGVGGAFWQVLGAALCCVTPSTPV